MMNTSDTLLLGVGNAFRGDDGAGIAVARRVQEQGHPGVRVLEVSGEGAELIDLFESAPHVIVVDAASSGSAPGTIHYFDATSEAIPSKFFNYSTHAFSVAEAIEMARALGAMPARLEVYGIEGKSFDSGIELTPPVSTAVATVADRVLATLQENMRS